MIDEYIINNHNNNSKRKCTEDYVLREEEEEEEGEGEDTEEEEEKRRYRRNMLLATAVRSVISPSFKLYNCCYLSLQLLVLISPLLSNANDYRVLTDQLTDRLQPRRRQSPATFLSHKQNLITGSANSPLSSPYNQFYLTNSVNSPHNGKCV